MLQRRSNRPALQKSSKPGPVQTEQIRLLLLQEFTESLIRVGCVSSAAAPAEPPFAEAAALSE